MKLNYKLYEGKFIDRPNRFLTRIEFEGKIIESHLPDPGRLKELLLPGKRVLIKKEDKKNRKTKYSTQAIYNNKTLVSLNTLLPNKFVEHLINNKKIEFLKDWYIYKREIKHGKHRFDFLLKKAEENLFLEVKSVTLVENKIAKFPDAITLRGKNHIDHLGEMSKNNIRSMVLFVVQRNDAISFQPQWEIDYKFAVSLYKAWKYGLEVRVINLKMMKNKLDYLGELPAKLNPIYNK